MAAAILAGRRRIAPHGLNGGFPGKTGRSWVEFAGGSRKELGGSESVRVAKDDVLVIKTPGGGGFGSK
jgi:N-methylhydantoinase B/oxoprolinase/acetone carboxylase alpha subunit